MLRLLSCLLSGIPQINLVVKISTEAQAPADPFLDQLSKDLTGDEKQGPNISPHLAVIINKLWQQNIFGDKFKDRLSKCPMPENCDKIFAPRCNEEIWDGENILNSHLRGQDIILQKITMQISKASSVIINVSDLILKMKDSGLQGVSANAYQLQFKNLITCTVGTLSILAKSCTDLNQYSRDNMKDQFQPSLRKLANNVPAGSALLMGDDLAGHIRSLNNTTDEQLTGKYLVKPENLPALPKKLCLRKERALSPEQLKLQSLFNWAKSIPEAKQTLKIQTDSVGHSPIYDLSQKVECFTAGNIHNHLSQWKSITSDPFIIDIVKSGLKLRFAEEPAQNIYHNIPVTKAEKQIISDEIQKLTKRGYISLHERGG